MPQKHRHYIGLKIASILSISLSIILCVPTLGVAVWADIINIPFAIIIGMTVAICATITCCAFAGVYVCMRRKTDPERLHRAIRLGDRTSVAELLERGVDANLLNLNQTWTPLTRAAYHGRRRITELLLLKGARVNATTSKGPYRYCDALFIATCFSHVSVIEILLVNGAAINAAGWKRVRYQGETPLLRAVINGRDDIVQILLRHGADIEQVARLGVYGKRYTPLLLAVTEKKATIIKILLDHGAILDKMTISGDNALSRALDGHCINIVNMLLDRGASVDTLKRLGDRWVTMADYACWRGSKKIAFLFCEPRSITVALASDVQDNLDLVPMA